MNGIVFNSRKKNSLSLAGWNASCWLIIVLSVYQKPVFHFIRTELVSHKLRNKKLNQTTIYMVKPKTAFLRYIEKQLWHLDIITMKKLMIDADHTTLLVTEDTACGAWGSSSCITFGNMMISSKILGECVVLSTKALQANI